MGRPLHSVSEKRVVEEARSKVRKRFDKLLEFLCDVVDGKIEGASVGDRIKASAELFDRCGLPRKAQFDAVDSEGTSITRDLLSAVIHEHSQTMNGNGLVPEDPPFDASAPNEGVH
jgi:predicted Zn-dependent protease with MMP-like domain